MKRFSFIFSLLGLAVCSKSQQLPPAAAEFQGLLNAPVCPLCRTPVEAQPVTLMVVGDNGVQDGSTLIYKTLVCPKDGVLFCVKG